MERCENAVKTKNILFKHFMTEFKMEGFVPLDNIARSLPYAALSLLENLSFKTFQPDSNKCV